LWRPIYAHFLDISCQKFARDFKRPGDANFLKSAQPRGRPCNGSAPVPLQTAALRRRALAKRRRQKNAYMCDATTFEAELLSPSRHDRKELF
jgi:hypothetical protein